MYPEVSSTSASTSMTAETFQTGIPLEVLAKLCSNSDSCRKTFKSYWEHNNFLYENALKIEERRQENNRTISKYEEEVKVYIKNELKFKEDLAFVTWQKDDLLIKLTESRQEAIDLKAEIEKNKLTITKFELASKTVDEILNKQVHDNLKNGIGYNTVKPPTKDVTANFVHEEIPEEVTKANPLNKIFVKASTSKIESTEESNSSKGKNKLDEELVDEEDLENELDVFKVKKNENIPLENHIITTELMSSSKKVDVKNVSQKENGFGKTKNVKTCNCSCDRAKFSQNSPVRGNQRNWNQLMFQKHGQNFQKHEKKQKQKIKACFICGKTSHLAMFCWHNPINKQHKSNVNNGQMGQGRRMSPGNSSSPKNNRDGFIFKNGQNWNDEHIDRYQSHDWYNGDRMSYGNSFSPQKSGNGFQSKDWNNGSKGKGRRVRFEDSTLPKRGGVGYSGNKSTTPQKVNSSAQRFTSAGHVKTAKNKFTTPKKVGVNKQQSAVKGILKNHVKPITIPVTAAHSNQGSALRIVDSKHDKSQSTNVNAAPNNEMTKQNGASVWKSKYSNNDVLDLGMLQESQTLKKISYIDAEGKPKVTEAWVPKQH